MAVILLSAQEQTMKRQVVLGYHFLALLPKLDYILLSTAVDTQLDYISQPPWQAELDHMTGFSQWKVIGRDDY